MHGRMLPRPCRGPSHRLVSFPAVSSPVGGASLIEVMVALIVLNIGLLGLGAMQLLSLRADSGALSRTFTLIQAGSLIESARGVRTSLAEFANPATQPTADCTQSPCSADEMAAHELDAWKDRTRYLLPRAETRIEADGEEIVVHVAWPETDLRTVERLFSLRARL